MSHGIVVEHKENGIWFAVSERNFNPKVHKKVHDLKPGETVRGYLPRRKQEASTSRAQSVKSEDKTTDGKTASK